MIPEIALDVESLRDGVFNGILLGLTAGGAGWMIRICFSTFNKIVGR